MDAAPILACLRVQRRISDPLGGLLFLNMNLRSEGLSWVKGICQKFETSCNEYVDACNNYVNTSGEHFKKKYDEVCEWEEAPGFEGSDLYSLEPGTLFGVPTRPFTELDNSNEKSSACEKVQVTVPISGGSQILHQRDICKKNKAESLLTASGRSDACAREESLSNEVDVLKHETIKYEVSTKTSTEACSHENLSIDGKLPRTVSASQGSDQVTFSNEPQDLSDRDTCDIDKQELLSTEATTCAYDTVERCKKNLDTITCSSSCSNSLRQDYILFSQSHHGGRSSIVSGIYKSEVAIPSMSSLGTEHDPQIGSDKSESSAQDPEIGEPIKRDSEGKEQNISSNSDVDNVNTNMELFEDVVLEDDWNYDEMDEIIMILDRVSKKTSYKEKLRSLFILKAGSLMGYNTADIRSYYVDLRYRHMVATSPVRSRAVYPNISSSDDSIESGWELL